MGCGCNKKKIETTTNTDNTTNTENNQKQYNSFRNVAENNDKTKGILNKINMVKSFATAIVSRGVDDKRVSLPVKQLRVLSCFGNLEAGGELPPCEHLKMSKTPGKHFCGGCGCGDKPHTWLMSNSDQYSKLDYPKLNCPLNMPGFSNYIQSQPDEANSPITRRYYVENMDFNIILKTNVSTPEFKPPHYQTKASQVELPPDSQAQQ